VAEDEEILDLVLEAPPHAHQPNVLLAAVHYLVLSGLEHPLAAVYTQGRASAHAPALFRDVCLTHRGEVLELISTRRTQTNECGRSARLALGLAVAADRVGEPLGLLDAGASAGLNLLLDEYRLDYGPHGALGPAQSPVVVDCTIRTPALRLPSRLPYFSRRVGLDRSPVDVTNADDVLWLLACVWPDTGRLPRTAAAIELARRHRPPVVPGDMVTDLRTVLDTFDSGTAVAVVTSWACAYLSATGRRQFVEILMDDGRRRPIAWVSAEGPGVVELFDPPPPAGDDTTPSVLGLALFDGDNLDVEALALLHPHGTWLDWRGATTVPA